MLLTVVIATGLACTIYVNLKVTALREAHANLRMRVGLFEETDPAKIHVVRAGVPEELVGPLIGDGKIWRYRLSVPASYHPCYHRHEGLVKEVAPGGTGSTSRHYGRSNSKPSEINLSISCIQDMGDWRLSVNVTGGGSSQNLPQDFPINKVDNLVIEEVVDFGITRSFDPDEAICLLRVREKNEARRRDGTKRKGLYRGFVVYMFDKKHSKAFDAWQNGTIPNMQGLEPLGQRAEL